MLEKLVNSQPCIVQPHIHHSTKEKQASLKKDCPSPRSRFSMDKERWTTLPRLGGTLKHPPLHLSETGRFEQAFKSRTLLQKSTSTLPFSHNADYETFTRITISQFDLVSSTSTLTAPHWPKHYLFSSLIIRLKACFSTISV